MRDTRARMFNTNCPLCRSNQVTSGLDPISRGASTYVETSSCDTCGALWNEIYSLTNCLILQPDEPSVSFTDITGVPI